MNPGTTIRARSGVVRETSVTGKIVVDTDDRGPSLYGASTIGDDSCEFNILYNTAKGAACEAAPKKFIRIVGNKWKATNRDPYLVRHYIPLTADCRDYRFYFTRTLSMLGKPRFRQQ